MTQVQTSRTRTKVCGVKDVQTALSTAALGVDAIGLVFHPASPRLVDLDTAKAIVEALPPFISSVALFCDSDADAVRRVMDHMPVTLLQFHGAESAAFCGQFNHPYIRSVPRDEHASASAFQDRYPDARGFLYDSNVQGQAGGLGETFQWESVEHVDGRPRILAGGLTPENVGAGIHAFAPQAVDVSSGVERERGVKDIERIAEFVAAVARADRERNQESNA